MGRRIWGLAGAVIALILLVVVVLDKGVEDACLPGNGSGSSGGGAGVVVDGDYAYPSDKEATTETSGFGPRWGTNHNGLDIAGPSGTPIYAFAEGRVVAAADTGVQGFGGWVILDHTIDGRQIQTVYGHMDPGGVLVKVGDRVSVGDHIANIGNSGFSTGPHLHFEVIEGDRAAGGTPVDPAPWVEKAETGRPAGDKDKADGAETKADGPDEESQRGERGDKASGVIPADVEGVAGLNGRQSALAKQIVAIGEVMGVDREGQIIAMATAKHESQLKVYANDGSGVKVPGCSPEATAEELRKSLNYPHDAVWHDFCSVGTFQQQIVFWGKVEDLMDPGFQAKQFYERLKERDYHGQPVGVVASGIQGNATGTGVYQAEAEIAEMLVDHFQGAGKEMSEEEIAALGTASTVGSADACLPGSPRRGTDLPNGPIGQKILAAAREQFGLPYVWGGGDYNGPTGGQGGGESGFDCSGLTQYAVYQATEGAVKLNHFTGDQQSDPQLETVSWEDRQPGDLLFTPGHVAIYAGEVDGQEMMYEAQTFDVPVGAYPVRGGESNIVRRVPAQTLADDKKDDAHHTGESTPESTTPKREESR